MTADPCATTTASIVIEYDGVSRDRETQFREWQQEIRAGVQNFPGYLRTDIFPAITGIQDKWHIAVHFDTPAHLSNWLDSDIRHGLIREGKSSFGSYRYRIGTGLERWFTTVRRSPALKPPLPAWKQNFAVLLGLYPTVMLETYLLDHFGLMTSWPLPMQMFMNNLVSCSLLTWFVMPWVSKLLKFWLQPAQQTRRNTLVGCLLLALAYSLMVLIFYQIFE